MKNFYIGPSKTTKTVSPSRHIRSWYARLGVCASEFQLLHIRDLSVLTCFERASRQLFLADLDSGGLGPHVFALWLSFNAKHLMT